MPETTKIRAGKSLLAYADQWFAHNRRHTVNTQKLYSRVINDFIQSLPADIGQLNPADIDIYINSLLSRMKNSAANSYLTALKSFFKWLNDTYELPNLAEKIKFLKEDPPEIRVLSHAEYQKVIKANAENPDVWILKFLANTGLRATEFCNVKPSDIEGKWLKVRGKGRKVRHVPLNRVALESLSHIKIPKNRDRLSYICQKAAKIAGVPQFGPHSLRHYCATELLRRGAPIASVSRLLGHSSVTVTEKTYWHFNYTHIENLTDFLL